MSDYTSSWLRVYPGVVGDDQWHMCFDGFVEELCDSDTSEDTLRKWLKRMREVRFVATLNPRGRFRVRCDDIGTWRLEVLYDGDLRRGEAEREIVPPFPLKAVRRELGDGRFDLELELR